MNPLRYRFDQANGYDFDSQQRAQADLALKRRQEQMAAAQYQPETFGGLHGPMAPNMQTLANAPIGGFQAAPASSIQNIASSATNWLLPPPPVQPPLANDVGEHGRSIYAMSGPYKFSNDADRTMYRRRAVNNR